MAAQLTGTNGPVGAPAVGVDGLGDELLAGAALAGDEHRRVRRRDLDDAAEHLADRLRAADDVLELVALLELAREELRPRSVSLRFWIARSTLTSSSCSVNGFWM